MNGNKKDNRLCNLEYVTPSENAQHAVKTGLVPLRFSEQDIADIRRRRAEGATLTVLSRQFHVDRGYLSHICNGKRRKA